MLRLYRVDHGGAPNYVAEREGRGRAGRRGQLERAGLAPHPVEQPMVRPPGQVRLRVAGHAKL